MQDKKQTNPSPLREDWASSLLGETVGDLKVAQENLRAQVEKCRKVLSGNPLTALVAQAACKAAGCEGEATLGMNDLGMLWVYLPETKEGEKLPANAPTKETTPTKKTAPKVTTKETSETPLPLIKELREKAEEIGIDWKPFGRSRTNLFQAIKEKQAEGATTAPPSVDPPKKMVKTAPALSPATVVPTPEPEPEPIVNPVETTPEPAVSPKDEASPSDSPKPKVDLKALAQESEALDIDDLLGELSPDEEEEGESSEE